MREILELLELTDRMAVRPALLFKLSKKDLSRLKEMEESVIREYIEMLLLVNFGPIARYFTPLIIDQGNNIYKFETPESFIKFIKEG